MSNEKRYLRWLLRRVGFSQINGRKRYGKLIDQLFHTPFRTIMTEDVQRALDGVYLRKEYGAEYGFLQDCSILEMLVQFAIRIETEWIGNPRNFRPDIMFWITIQNLGLDLMFDDGYNPGVVDHILSTWMDRNYNPDGSGGIFPMKHTDRDQRKVSLWDQMLEYITENNMY